MAFSCWQITWPSSTRKADLASSRSDMQSHSCCEKQHSGRSVPAIGPQRLWGANVSLQTLPSCAHSSSGQRSTRGYALGRTNSELSPEFGEDGRCFSEPRQWGTFLERGTFLAYWIWSAKKKEKKKVAPSVINGVKKGQFLSSAACTMT